MRARRSAEKLLGMNPVYPMLEPRQESHESSHPKTCDRKVQSRYQMIDFPEIYRNAMEFTAKYTRGSWIKVPFNHFCNDGDGDMILDAVDCHFSAATPELQLEHGRSTGGVSGLRKNCLGFRASGLRGFSIDAMYQILSGIESV